MTGLNNVAEPVDARDADLQGSRFTDVTLAGATFHRVDLPDAALSDVAMSQSGVPRHQPGRRPVRGRVARGATVVDANLTGLTINGCNIAGLRIDGVDIAALLAANEKN